jgi:predicted ABC-type ATPase
MSTVANPTLILIRGLPGSGKSYLATALQESLGEENVLILDPDKVDLTSKEYHDFSDALTKEGVDEKFHPYRWSRSQAYDAIEAHKIIIWNQGFTNLDGFNKTVVNLQTYASDHGTHLPLLVVEVEIDHDLAKQRVATRVAQGGHNVDDENFARFINDYATFAGQGYDPVVVNGKDEVSVSVASVLKALKELQKR